MHHALTVGTEPNAVMSETTTRSTMSEATLLRAREVMAGTRGWRSALVFAGPAVIASIAYMDPGNFATNVRAGSSYGYRLLWVVVVANLIAMLLQSMAAKLGIVTGRNLAELSRAHFPHALVMGMWGVSEIAAMATDLAEFLGGAIGLSLLFHLPLLYGMVATGIVTYSILLFDRAGFRPLELIIGGLVSVIGLCYLIETFLAPPEWRLALLGTVVPSLPDPGAITLAVGIVGATVMPHAIYLHSGLTQARVPPRNDRERAQLVRYSNRETVVALTLAGLVNMAMVAMAARVFHAGHSDVAEIETAYHTLVPLLGAGAAGIYLASLMASGISSSVVGTMAGQIIMQGFVGFRVPIWVRRAATMVPAFAVVAAGFNATQCLIVSQVVLSLALPVPMIALVVLSRRPAIMGRFVLGGRLAAVAVVATVIVLALNLILLLQAAGVEIPGLPTG